MRSATRVFLTELAGHMGKLAAWALAFGFLLFLFWSMVWAAVSLPWPWEG